MNAPATVDDMKILHDPRDGWTNSLELFQGLKKDAKRITMGKETLNSDDPRDIVGLETKLWVLDRFLNNPWQYGGKQGCEVVSDNGKKVRFDSYSSEVIPGYVGLDGKISEEIRIQSWMPIVALYRRAKEVIYVNDGYARAMGVRLVELQKYINESRAAELFASENAKKLQELTFVLSQGRWYKDEILTSSKTGRKVAWYSLGNDKSGSIRIGKDVTHGEILTLEPKRSRAFSIEAEKSMAAVADRVRSLVLPHADETSRISIETKLRVLATCAVTLDVAWERGPYLMNIVSDDRERGMRMILWNRNYADLIGRQAMLPMSELYAPEQLARIEQKFAEGLKDGHYESEFTMKLADGREPTFSWHRHFPLMMSGIDRRVSFGVGTTSVTDLQKRRGVKGI